MTEKVSSLGREAGSAIRWNALGAVVSVLSQFLQLLVLARWLPPGQFGLAASAIAVVGFAQGFADLGLTNALVQRSEVDENTWCSAARVCTLCGLMLLILVTASAHAFEALLHLPGLTPLLCAAALVLPFTGATAVFQAYSQRQLKFSQLARAEIIAATFSLIAALGWACWRREAMALVVGQIVLAMVRCGALGFTSSLSIFRGRMRLSDLRPLATYGSYQMGERALNFAAGNLDRLLVARWLGAEAAGFYTVASQIALRPLVLLAPFVFRTLFPLLSRLQEEQERLASSFLRATSLLGLAAAGIYALLFGLAEPLVHLVLGPGWDAVAPLLRILAGLGFIWTVTQPVGSVILALGRARVGFWLNVIVLAANALAVFYGARFGVVGVAWGMLWAAILLLPLDFYLARRWLGVNAIRFGMALAWPLFPAFLSGGLTQAMSALPVWAALPPKIRLGFQVMISAGLYVAAAFLLNRRKLMDAVTEIRVKLGSG